jgi:hypothetical protein
MQRQSVAITLGETGSIEVEILVIYYRNRSLRRLGTTNHKSGVENNIVLKCRNYWRLSGASAPAAEIG